MSSLLPFETNLMRTDRPPWISHVPASHEHRLMVFFGLAYFAQGLAGSLISQPLTYYLKSTGMTADQVAQSIAMAALPWMLKPLYGLLSDFIPLLGYRRKSYLFMAAGLATIGYVCLTQLRAPGMIVGMLFLTTLGIAAGDVMVDALMVENGLKSGLIKQFQAQQWTWLHLAAMTAGLVGGWFCEIFTPVSALHTAAFIIGCAPAVVMITTCLLVDEQKVRLERARLRSTARDLRTAMKSKPLWIVAGFLAFWNITPGFGIPLYYYMSNDLKFDQYFIGQLTSIASVGAAIGAFVYRRYLAERISTKRLVSLSIMLSIAMAIAHLFLVDSQSAMLLYFSGGMLSMIPLLTVFALAASVCPPHVAGFIFAALMAVYSAAAQISGIVGAHLYEQVYHQQIAPLICTAAGFTLTACLWVPFLPTEHHSGSTATSSLRNDDLNVFTAT